MTARRARRAGWVVVALLVLVGIALAARSTSEPRLIALIALDDLTAGTVLDEMAGGRLTPVEIAAPSETGLVLAPSELPAGSRLVSPLSVGEPLTWSALGGRPGLQPLPLGPGERAIALPASAFGSSALALAAGARVDLVAVGDGRAPPAVLVSDAEILMSSSSTEGDDGLLLRVPKEDALAVAGAVGYSQEVRVIVRPPGESGDLPNPVSEALAPTIEPTPSQSRPPADLGDSLPPDP